MSDNDPPRPYQRLPDRPDPAGWVTETDPDPVPGAIGSADAEHAQRDALFGPGA